MEELKRISNVRNQGAGKRQEDTKMDQKTIINWLYSALSAPNSQCRNAYLELVSDAMPRCLYTAEGMMRMLESQQKYRVLRILDDYGF